MILFLAWYGALWLLLSEGKGWLFGATFSVLATWLSLHLGFSLRKFRPLRLPRFLFFYLKEILAAGCLVAWAACRPRMSVQPRWVSLTLKSQVDRTRMLLATLVCLLPGTLTSHVRRGEIQIHLLDETKPWRPTVEKLESHLMALLGEDE